MIIIGVDFHPEFQQIALVDTDTGELRGARLAHPDEAEEVLSRSGEPGTRQVRVGMEASGHGALVRAAAGRVADRAVDRRCRRDPNQASTQAEDGSARCPAHFEADAEGSTFRRSGCRAGRTAICGNCSGIGTAWCRPVRGS